MQSAFNADFLHALTPLFAYGGALAPKSLTFYGLMTVGSHWTDFLNG